MNPCPAGCDINEYGQCECSSEQLRRYRNKISAPLLDRIDLQVNVPKLPSQMLFNKETTQTENWPQIQTRINTARNIQIKRQEKLNGLLTGNELQEICCLTKETQTEFILLLAC